MISILLSLRRGRDDRNEAFSFPLAFKLRATGGGASTSSDEERISIKFSENEISTLLGNDRRAVLLSGFVLVCGSGADGGGGGDDDEKECCRCFS